jgi:hypothetical protein
MNELVPIVTMGIITLVLFIIFFRLIKQDLPVRVMMPFFFASMISLACFAKYIEMFTRNR